MPAWSRSMLNMYISLISLVLLLVLRCHSTIIQTNGSTLHFWKGTADCPNGEPCSIYCDTGKGGGGICELATFNCPTDAQCDLFCGPSSFACRGAIVNCPLTADCNVYCSGTGGQNICNGLKPIWSPNGQNRLTCEGANGHNMCSSIHDFPVPPSDEPMVLNCEGTSKCSGSHIICPFNADCTIYCHANTACVGAVITWSTNGINTLDCDPTKTDPCLNIQTVTQNPTAPSFDPTDNPSTNPSNHPTSYSSNPTDNPSVDPTSAPTVDPSNNPSNHPTSSSSNPTDNPTSFPSTDPSVHPTAAPSTDPTGNPSQTASITSTNYTISIDMSECVDEMICGDNRQGLERRIIVVLSNNTNEVTYIQRQVIDDTLVIQLSVKTKAEQVLDVDYIRYHIEKEIEDYGSDTFGAVSVSVDGERKAVETTESGNDSDQISDMLSYVIMAASALILVVILICIVVCLVCVFKQRKKAAQAEMLCMSGQQTTAALDTDQQTVDALEPGQQATNTATQTNQTDLQMISTVAQVTSIGTTGETTSKGYEASSEEQREDEMDEDTEDESHESLYDGGQTATAGTCGDTAGGNTAAGDGTPGMALHQSTCKDCGLLKEGKLFEVSGYFYCNDCWVLYD
eukprot:543628_1